jgi:basic membrane protein A
MKKLACLVLLAVLGSTVSAQTGDLRGLKVVVSRLAGDSAVAGRQYVVLIAVDSYRSWPALRNPVKDARQLREILARRYYVTDFLELYNENATKAAIIRLFNRLIAETVPEDSVLIFYAGHGHLDETSNTGFWIPVDGGTDVYEQANWLPNAQLRGFIMNMKARHIALLADSCFSGDILNPSRGMAPTITSEYFRNAYTRVSRQILTSGASEAVPDESPFSRQIKLALEGNTSPYLDLLMLYNQIRLGVKGTTPLFGDLKDSGHQEGSSFLLFLKEAPGQAGSPAQPSVPTFKLEQVSAKVSVVTKATGTLLLDGVVQGLVPAGRLAALENVPAGVHELQMRFENGGTEKIDITIASNEPVSVTFGLSPATPAAQPPAAPRAKIGLVFGSSGRDDLGWNDLAYEGLVKTAEASRGWIAGQDDASFGREVQIRCVDPRTDGQDRAGAVRALAKEGFNPVFCVGAESPSDLPPIAGEFPKTHFIAIDGWIPNLGEKSNITCVHFAENEGMFLVGAIAGLRSNGQKIGFLGGMDIPMIRRFDNGFRAGAMYVEPRLRKVGMIVNRYLDSFDDPQKGYVAAVELFRAGAAIVGSAAGGSGHGLFKAAAEFERLAIGVDVDQGLWFARSSDPDERGWAKTVITSMRKRYDVAVRVLSKEFIDRGTVAGGYRMFTLRDDGLEYVVNDLNRAALADIRTKLDELKQKIVRGQIVVPDETTNLQDWLKTLK